MPDFSKLGYKKSVMHTSWKGEFEEFHDQADVVEIGTVLFNTKTNQVVGFVSEEKIETNVASATAAMSIDPHCERYPWITPYAYCLNNPVRFVDPDGRDIKIYYLDENGKGRAWIFNGSNQDKAPNNQFVSDFITAYSYNMKNGGGDQLQAAATATDYTLSLTQRKKGDDSYFETVINSRGETEGSVFWNPTIGLETPKGTLSPATILEHEMDHGVHWQTKTVEHIKGQKTEDSHFGNKEEKRVMTGSEYKTGVANGELKPISKGRENNNSSYRKHSGNVFVPVISPISNKKKP